MIRNHGSFRDPSGQIFCREVKIYRCIFSPGVKDFEAARDAGVYDKLIEIVVHGDDWKTGVQSKTRQKNNGVTMINL